MNHGVPILSLFRHWLHRARWALWSRGRARVGPWKRPRLEVLEDRLTPAAAIAVTTLADVVDAGDGKVSLREAITMANATAEPDTIVLKAGVYKIARAGVGEDGNATGDFDVTNPLTLKGQGTSTTVLDAARVDRLFDLIGSFDVKFANLTLRHGGALVGGAIQAVHANIKLTKCTVSDNQALTGGGIYAGNGDVTLLGTTVSRNVVTGDGGGIHAEHGAVVLSNSSVRRNLAAIDGGGIKAVTAELTSSTVSHNNAINNGGGIHATIVKLTSSTVSGNTAHGFGGGIFAVTAELTSSTVSGNAALFFAGGIFANTAELTSSTVSGNRAGDAGGGIFATVAILTNSTVSGNTAQNSGGGIHANAGMLTNCTVTENIAHNGGGVLHLGSETFIVKNSIIAQNLIRLDGVGADASGDFDNQGHNLIGIIDGSSGFFIIGGGNTNVVGTAANPLHPGLGPLADNGGPTLTHALKQGSRAIDHIDNSDAPATDQRGAVRPQDGDGNGSRFADIGAFER